mmetsp:Transcript_14611/g.37083  ORF Transcript_14611/g.37083 Transcript_14611/m.37083 type:complete len:153 (+) Transcript_14611:770-1228(+)
MCAARHVCAPPPHRRDPRLLRRRDPRPYCAAAPLPYPAPAPPAPSPAVPSCARRPGVLPAGFEDCVYICDGTKDLGKRSRIYEQQELDYSGNKGHGKSHLLFCDLFGKVSAHAAARLRVCCAHVPQTPTPTRCIDPPHKGSSPNPGVYKKGL